MVLFCRSSLLLKSGACVDLVGLLLAILGMVECVCVCHFWVWQWVFACNENQMVVVASEWDHPNNGGALQCVCSVFTDCRTYSDAEIQQTVQEIALCAVQGVCSPVRAHRIACHSIVWCWVCVVPQDRQGDSTNSTGTSVKIETVLRGIISYLTRSCPKKWRA